MICEFLFMLSLIKHRDLFYLYIKFCIIPKNDTSDMGSLIQIYFATIKKCLNTELLSI